MGYKLVSSQTGRPPNVIHHFWQYLMIQFGLCEINVFNFLDLHQSDNFFTLKRQSGDSWSLVPFNGEEGERLSWHMSDKLYFGNSVKWRRSFLDMVHDCAFNETDKYFLNQLIQIDNNQHSVKSEYYKLDFYHQKLPQYSLKENMFKQAPITHTCSMYVDANLNILNATQLANIDRTDQQG